ncbi:DUF4123 domain-containing protein [Bacillus subtilis subsp. subtilis]|nr:DUF4123 domain-containing protein [Bacillus subtilis subsp. subtilis]
MDLDSPVTAPIDMGHRTFLAQTHAIIDPIQVAAAQFADLPVQALEPAELKGCLRQPPLLVTLEALPWERRLALLDRADAHLQERGRPLFCTLLACEDPTRLRGHLQHLMGLWRPGNGRAWFRVHDPRVFRHLRWLLTPAQMAHVMGPVHAWTWHEPLGGTWRTHERPATRAPFGFLLRPDQFQSLDQLGVLNGCLRDLVQDAPGTGSTQLRTLMDGVLEARGVGIADAVDLRLYACQRLRHGAGFHHQPTVHQRLQHVGQGMSYAMACRLDLPPALGEAAA